MEDNEQLSHSVLSTETLSAFLSTLDPTPENLELKVEGFLAEDTRKEKVGVLVVRGSETVAFMSELSRFLGAYFDEDD